MYSSTSCWLKLNGSLVLSSFLEILLIKDEIISFTFALGFCKSAIARSFSYGVFLSTSSIFLSSSIIFNVASGFVSSLKSIDYVG